jgi:hypothetical protein
MESTPLLEKQLFEALSELHPVPIELGWIEAQTQKLKQKDSLVILLVDIAQRIGRTGAAMWRQFFHDLQQRSIEDKELNYFKIYCRFVVDVEEGKFHQLLTLPPDHAFPLAERLLGRVSLEEKCIYVGLLKSKDQSSCATEVLSRLVERYAEPDRRSMPFSIKD